jgi:hypothetical protein
MAGQSPEPPGSGIGDWTGQAARTS